MKIKTGLAAFGLSGQIFHAPFIEAHPDFELTAVAERSKKSAPGDMSRRRIGRFVRGIAALRRRTDRRQHARRNPLSAVPGRLGSRETRNRRKTVRHDDSRSERTNRDSRPERPHTHHIPKPTMGRRFPDSPADRPARLAGQARRDTVLFPTIPPPTRTIRMERDTGRHPRRNHI